MSTADYYWRFVGAMRKERKQRGMTQRELADAAGCWSSEISNAERGRAVLERAKAARIASRLELDVDQEALASSALAAREELKSAREKRDATIRSRIAPFVKRMREERGMTQGGLADAVGFATSCFISRIEDGLAMPSRKQLAAIADALGVSYHRLVNGGLVEGDIFFAREELADAVGVIEGCGGGLDQMVGVAFASEIRSYADGSKTPSSEGLAKVVSSLRLSYSDVIGISLDVPACEMRRVLDRFDSLAGYASRQCDRLLPSPVA